MHVNCFGLPFRPPTTSTHQRGVRLRHLNPYALRTYGPYLLTLALQVPLLLVTGQCSADEELMAGALASLQSHG